MISSILDNDLYKFTMQQAVHSLYPRAEVKYGFINRGDTRFPDDFSKHLKAEVLKMADLKLLDDELNYLHKTCYFLTPVYLEFLQHFRYSPEHVSIEQSDGKLFIDIKGPWYQTILWEIPLLAMISELYFSLCGHDTISADERRILNIKKGEQLRDSGVDFADFGTRRRFSLKNQDNVLKDLLFIEDNTLIGTSNVFLAKQHNIKPIGTLSHEWFMFHAGEHGYKRANLAAINAWISVYQGNLGIALADTFTTDLFLQNFDSVNARLFDGVRQDSGDPYVFVDKLINHYNKLRINPFTKTIIFSDGLSPAEAVSIKDYCQGKINVSFGIGTNLSNDIGPEPLNIVIKLSDSRYNADSCWMPMIKLSDVKSKYTGDADEIDLCLRTIKRTLA